VTAELAYHAPFLFWALLCAGALAAFLRAITAPPRADLEKRGVFSTLSDRLAGVFSAGRVRAAILAGVVVGVPLTWVALRLVWRADPHGVLHAAGGAWSTLALIGAGWLFLSIGLVVALVLALATLLDRRAR